MTNGELLDALNRLDAFFSDESKWCHHGFARYDSESGVTARCVLNAADFVLRGSAESLWEEFYKTLPAYRGKLGGWNDAPERTFADIKRLIADTRARLEAA